MKVVKSVLCIFSNLVKEKACFIVKLKRHLSTHCFFSVGEFLMFKN